jgi:hypothetical protein
MRRHLVSILAASLALGLLGPTASWAGSDERVAILDFDGRGSERFERHVRKIVKREATVISDRRYQRTARKLGARSMHAGDVAEVAAKMELDAVVNGRMVKRKGKRYLKVWVRDGANGKVVDRFMVSARKRSLGSKARRALKKRLRRAIGEASDVTRRAERKIAKTKKRRSKRRAKKRKAREREEHRMAARAKAKYDDSGQAIDNEKPPGL